MTVALAVEGCGRDRGESRTVASVYRIDGGSACVTPEDASLGSFEGCYLFRPEDLALLKVGSCIKAAIPDPSEPDRFSEQLSSVEVLDRKCRINE